MRLFVDELIGHYHIDLDMYCMWSMWFSYKRYKLQVPCKLKNVVLSWWWNLLFHMWRL